MVILLELLWSPQASGGGSCRSNASCKQSPPGVYSAQASDCFRDGDYLTQKHASEAGSVAPMMQIMNDDWTIGASVATV
jgi:hypothetical protein